MQGYRFEFHGAEMEARESGALWWSARRMLVVSDLHLGKSGRMARRGGVLLPPYEGHETLMRLEGEIAALAPETVTCLGDSFDDPEAATLPQDEALWLARLMAGRDWIWVEGNHDPGPVVTHGRNVAELHVRGIVLRHIARPGAVAEISGHYHPKVRLAGQSRPAFLLDRDRLILPAFGAYTGGLRVGDPVIAGLLRADARAILTGKGGLVVPARKSGD